jgi:hypothetical protein
MTRITWRPALLLACAAVVYPPAAAAQTPAGAASAPAQVRPAPPDTAPASHRPFGRVSFTFDTFRRRDADARRGETEFGTAVHLETPDFDGNGIEYGVNMRQSGRSGSDVQRLSIYDGFAGMRVGPRGQIRLRAGHMWLPDLGTVGALAGGLVEVRQHRADPTSTRVRAGAFLGREPLIYEMGYARSVRKVGGYVAVEQGFMRRHAVGYTRVQQGSLTERAVVTITNFVPAGRSVFVYQAAEVDASGPANGEGKRGLSYLLTNVRVSAGPRVELFGTYSRGRSVDARALTDDLRNGRALTPQRLEGLLYQSTGGRVTVEVARNVRVYAGYWRDRNNRDDAVTGRTLIGGHAGNLLGTGFDVSASNSRIDRPLGPYNSKYVSVGHAIGRAAYLSVDYATSLSVVRFLRSDGLVIETRPWMRRVTANGSVTLGRRLGLQFMCDFDRDDTATQVRMLTGLSVRF